MLRVALTGGIATGKTESLRHFARLGAPVLDADQVARDVVEPGTATLAAVVARFGHEVLDANGALNRARLGRVAFGDTTARKDLENILHPAIYKRIQAWFEALEASASPPAAAIAEIPLLFETGRAADFDAVVVTSCSVSQQEFRLHGRDSLQGDDARQRVRAQWPLDEKVRRADYVIDTSGAISDTHREVERVWAALSS
jgi:dephospho-CoA kinase